MSEQIKTIITEADKLLEPSSPLEFIDETGTHPEEGQKIIDQLIAAMEADKSIIALAAPQIGITKRILCIRFDTEIKVFINPIITRKSDYKIGVETCPSMPNKEILITRPESLTVVYYNKEFKYEDNKLVGAAARIFDQQTNLLDGVLPSELGLVSDITEDGSLEGISDEEFKQLIEIYKKFISIKALQAKQAVEQDPELSEVYKKLKFTEDVINDRIQVIHNPDEDKKLKMNRAQRRATTKMAKQLKAKKAGKR